MTASHSSLNCKECMLCMLPRTLAHSRRAKPVVHSVQLLEFIFIFFFNYYASSHSATHSPSKSEQSFSIFPESIIKYLFCSHCLAKGHHLHLGVAGSGMSQHAATVHVPKSSSVVPMPRWHPWHLWLPARLNRTRVNCTSHCGEMTAHQEYWRLRTGMLLKVWTDCSSGGWSLEEQLSSHTVVICCSSPFPWFFSKHRWHLTALNNKDFHNWLPKP